jgi:hypothetical protein
MKCSKCPPHGHTEKVEATVVKPCISACKDEEYNGWSNRETWAANLHMTNDEGWSKSLDEAVVESHARGDSKYGTGHAIEQVFNDYLDGMADFLSSSGTLMGNFEMVLRDVGSVWRVNWTEIAEGALSGLET